MYNPAYGTLIGASTMGIYLGEPASTPISSAVIAMNMTARVQVSST